jgi:hypothetical protein
MTASTLGRLLSLFENSPGSLSIASLARELDISPGRVEEMVEFWIRKGRIKASSQLTDCGTCSVQGGCPFILEMPRTFEIVKGGADHPGPVIQPACR